MKTFLLISFSLIFMSCVFGCNSEEANSSIQSLDSEHFSSEHSDSSEIEFAKIINPIFGKYAYDTRIEKKDIELFMENIGGWCPYEQSVDETEIDITWITCWGASVEENDDDYAEVYLFNSYTEAEEYYYSVFEFSSKLEVASKIKYSKLASAVQIGNAIVVGGNSVVVPLLQKYEPSFKPTSNYAPINTIESYKQEINIEKICKHMYNLGYTHFSNHIEDHGVYTHWHGFMNFETNDFCYIMKLEENDGKSRAELYFRLVPSNYGATFLYTEDCVLVSNTEVWNKILSEI